MAIYYGCIVFIEIYEAIEREIELIKLLRYIDFRKLK